MRSFFFLLLPAWVVAQTPQPGFWRGVLDLGRSEELPFEFEWVNDQMEIINGAERLQTNPARYEGDTLVIECGFFHSEFRVRLKPGRMEGYWIDLERKPEYRLPFRATEGAQRRFQKTNSGDPAAMAPRWEIHFSPGKPGAYPAIGLFEQRGEDLFASFATETGDYRFLAGQMDGKRFRLSSFDGAHAFLFTGELIGADSLKGEFFSGKHWREPFAGRINPSFELRDPDSLTFLRPGYERLEFSFPDPDSQWISLSDERFRGKVVLVQILGTWRPNCMDETRFLTRIYPDYHPQGFEVIGLAFERSAEFRVAAAQVRRMRARMEVPYSVLVAGNANKTAAAEQLPALNHVMSFPTAILIDRQGRVRHIHTGFYGPATGEYYSGFAGKFVQTLETLLAE